MIISASRRCDIAAFHAEWFMNRVRAGEVLVRNPMQKKQISKISLQLDDVDAFVFWTKNPTALMPFLPELNTLGYAYYFLFTITPYDATVEPHVPEKKKMVTLFQRLATLVGAERVLWRYDPILLTKHFTPTWHTTAFQQVAQALSGYTKRCIISFFDDYRKVQQRMQPLAYIMPDATLMKELVCSFAEIAHRHNITLATCCETLDVAYNGVTPAHCIDRALVEQISGRLLVGIKKDSNQRPACGCAKSYDIGAYNCCAHGCLYCYAVANHAKAAITCSSCNALSPLLCDTLQPDDVVTERFSCSNLFIASKISNPTHSQSDCIAL